MKSIMTILDLDSMRHLNNNQEASRWEKSLKIEHQRIFQDLEITTTRAKFKRDLHIVCILNETQSIMTTLDQDNMKLKTSKEKE